MTEYIIRAANYGARELKRQINSNTILGFATSLLLIILIFALYFTAILNSSETEVPTYEIKIKSDTLELLPPDILNKSNPEVPEKIDVRHIRGFKEIAGKYKSVEKLKPGLDTLEIADFSKIWNARSTPGTETESSLSRTIDKVYKDSQAGVWESEKDENKEPIYEIFDVQSEPQIDMKQMQRLIMYPEIARKINIGGKVVVRALVGKDGRVVKTEIEYTDSELLNRAAIDAILKASFIPAMQNGNNVACWVVIPVEFKLR